jgi:uncharacterized membrane protein
MPGVRTITRRLGIRTIAGRPGRTKALALGGTFGLVAAEIAVLAGLDELRLVELGESESARLAGVALGRCLAEALFTFGWTLGEAALALDIAAGTASLTPG